MVTKGKPPVDPWAMPAPPAPTPQIPLPGVPAIFVADRRCSHRAADGQVCGAPVAKGYNWCSKCRETATFAHELGPVELTPGAAGLAQARALQQGAISQTDRPEGALAGAWMILGVLCVLPAGVGFAMACVAWSDGDRTAAVSWALLGLGGVFWSMVCWTARRLLVVGAAMTAWLEAQPAGGSESSNA
jgi:hypothetical protein